MAHLSTELRNQLEKTVIAARDEAEKAARASLIRLAVHEKEPYTTLSADERDLRTLLRTEAARLNGTPALHASDNSDPSAALVSEVAYAQWHRMLFARFLAENGLLIHPTGAAVTLAECDELASSEGEPDGWMLAARYASLILPGIFRADDPATRVRFDAAGRLALEKLLGRLPSDVFTADDSLGWVYQFWQSKRKQQVNKSGVKIGGADISVVTQLFTEPYMVQFLLHNSLGAWWAARHPGEPLPTDLDYLRRNEDGTPAAGSFPAWPDRAADLRILDPCCGSGHFLVASFALMCRFRMAEEGLTEREAGDAVIRDNLFGLELDPRCTQIAAFALALTAWKSGGYRELPLPNIACSGIPVGTNDDEFTHLADGDPDMEATLRQLHRLFQKAPDLGSLIDPERTAREEGKTAVMESMFTPEWDKIAAKLETAFSNQQADDPAAMIFGVAAQGVARAADFLTGRYHLVTTNVPYLARGKQAAELRKHIDAYHNDAKADLATAFVDRCLRLCTHGGTAAVVTPQNWLFLGSYKAFRTRLLTDVEWNTVARLGPGAFETIGGEVVNVALAVLTTSSPSTDHTVCAIDVQVPRLPAEKARMLRCGIVNAVLQSAQLKNPDARIALDDQGGGTLLEEYAESLQGVSPADFAHYGRCFWEVASLNTDWHFWQSTVDSSELFGGREHVLWMNKDFCEAVERGSAYIRGQRAWKRKGVTVSAMGQLPVTLYTGGPSDTNVAIIIPRDDQHLGAIWCFCSSPEYHAAVRRIDQALKVTNASLVKVPFDLDRWLQVAADLYPTGMPVPQSDDPTQWLFHGTPVRSAHPLNVAIARLTGYRWPQNDVDDLDRFADADGIVCLPPVAGEPPAAQRLRELLAAAYGAESAAAAEERLLAEAGFAGRGLEAWLREGFFAQHCRLFHNRPFLWHIWDGHKDGFSAIVNYHRLDRQNLERLIYTYLQSWIAAQRDADKNGVAGASARLVAALSLQEKLKLIAEGESPYDIYVRWKPTEKQAIGWEPEINDGVRMNIRPFVTAGVLRSKVTVNWNKDRGTNPDGSERLNDLHHTRAQKEEARRVSNSPSCDAKRGAAKP